MTIKELIAANGGRITVGTKPSGKHDRRPHAKLTPLPQGLAYIIDRTPEGQVIWGCRHCNWTLTTDTDEPIRHRCGQAQVVRLGDRVESALTSIGITKERWQAVRKTIGLPPDCQCDRKHAWLNQLDESLQLGEKLSAISKALGWG